MSIIYVRPGFLGTTYAKALEKARAGDTLVLTAGTYDEFPELHLAGLRIIGDGADGSSVVLHAMVRPTGNVILQNLTLQAPHYANALQMQEPTASVTLESVCLAADPTCTWPAAYIAGGRFEARSLRTIAPTGGISVDLMPGTVLNACDSSLGVIRAARSTIELTRCVVSTGILSAGTRMNARGGLMLSPAPDMRGLALNERTVATIDTVTSTIEDLEIAVNDSSLTASSIRSLNGAPARVLVENRGHLQTPDPTVQIVDVAAEEAKREAERRQRAEEEARLRAVEQAKRDAESRREAEEKARREAERRRQVEEQARKAAEEAARQEAKARAAAEDRERREAEKRAAAEAAPRQVMWFSEDAGRYEEAVAPYLRAGDTLVLEPGTYQLPYHPLELNFDIQGRGPRDEIHLQNQIAVSAGRRVSVTGLTLHQPQNGNSVSALTGGHVTLTDVRVESDVASSFPAVVALGASITLQDTWVNCAPGVVTHAVSLQGASQLTAYSCDLGWVHVQDDSLLTLTDSVVMQLQLHGQARVMGSGVLRLSPNEALQRSLVVMQGTELSADHVVVDQTSEFYCEGGIRITRLECPETATLYVNDGATYEIGGDAPAIQAISHEEPAPEVEVESEAEAPEELYAHQSATDGPSATPDSPPGAGDESEAVDQPTPLERLHAMTGLTEVKKQVAAFVTRVRFDEIRRQRGLHVEPSSLHSMFLGNPGTGKTTVARLLGQALHQEGVIATGTFVEAQRTDLVAEHIGGTAVKTRKKLEEALGGILFIDEAYSLAIGGQNDFGHEAVNTILTFMEDHRDEIMVIFAGYTNQMQDFLSMNPGLASRVPHRFDFEDYSPEELAAMGLADLKRKAFEVEDESLYRRLIGAAYRRASDRSNGRWVRNQNERLVAIMAERVMSLGLEAQEEALTQVLAVDLHTLFGTHAGGQGLDDLLEKLDSMVGLESVKRWVHDVVAQAQADAKLLEHQPDSDRPTYHMLFTGNPGTGKTTVARIVAGVFHRLGMLDSPQVVEADRSRLVGQYIGETEKKTTRIVDEAMGGVLFVDEAYQLTPARDSNDFGRQAMETLLTRLENDRAAFIAIFAGYTKEMEQFLEVNPGLRSRIPHHIEFPDYTPEEVADIVEAILSKKGWRFDSPALREAVKQHYTSLPAHHHANGRSARNIADTLERAHKRWIVTNDVTPDALLDFAPETIAQLTATGG